ncbi:hypothetical protein BKG84_18635 [Mycobacteroides chelonae]|uniref:Uncharacterized protein n=2 Tax=Mycobacteroides chelonae TaxID=1774 RepID=A0A1S1MDI2_MYCCH|nr:hypothetical protein BKG84_18635 [Mycobacteroides chelonae]
MRYWHGGWSGRKVGELLLPIAKQESFYAECMRAGIQQARAQSKVPDFASGRIYDINKLYVTSNRDFAHAWAVCMPDRQHLENLQMLFGLGKRAYYEVELLDALGKPLTVPPDPDPDYAVESFQVEIARVIAVHRPQMSPAAGQVHMLRMATVPRVT